MPRISLAIQPMIYEQSLRTHAFLSKLSPFISKIFTTLLFPTPPPIIEQPRNISRQKYTPVERKKRRLWRERRAKSSRKWRDRDTGRSSTNFESGAGAQMKNGHPINPSWSRASTKDLRCRSQFARSPILLPARFSSWDINASQPQYTPPPLSLSLLLHHLHHLDTWCRWCSLANQPLRPISRPFGAYIECVRLWCSPN